MLRRFVTRVLHSNIPGPTASVTSVMYATGGPYNILLNDTQMPVQLDVDWAQLSRQWVDQQLASSVPPFSQYTSCDPVQPFSPYCASNPAFVADSNLPNQSENWTTNPWNYDNNINQEISWYNFVPDPTSFYERFYALSGRSSSPHSTASNPRESRGSSPVDINSKTQTNMPETYQVAASEVSCGKDEQTEHKCMPNIAAPKGTKDVPKHKQHKSSAGRQAKETSLVRNKRKQKDERKNSEQSHKHRRRSPEQGKKKLKDFEDLLKKILGEDSSSHTLMDMYTHLGNAGKIDFMDKMKGLRNRQWHLTDFGRDFKKQQKKSGSLRSKYIDFKIMSYNVLSQDLLEGHPHLYQHCPSQWLKWHYRSRNILQELTNLCPDILCLQEVHCQHYENFYYPKMSKLGYDAVFQKRTGDKNDGCATFYRKSKFELEKSVGVEYYHPEDQLLDRDNIGLLVLLRPQRLKKHSDVRLCVANTHLLFNPRRGDIKLAQLMKLFSEIDKLTFLRSLQTGKPLYHPIIFCGDLNLLPHSDLYKFIIRGHMPYEGMPIKPLSGQDFYGDKSRCMGKVLVCGEAGMSDHCIYVSELQNRLDCKQQAQTKGDLPPNPQTRAEVAPNTEVQAELPPNVQVQVKPPPSTQVQAELPPNTPAQVALLPDIQAQAEQPPIAHIQAELSPNTEAQTELSPNTQAKSAETNHAQAELLPNMLDVQSKGTGTPTSADTHVDSSVVNSEASASSICITDLTQPDEGCVDMTQPSESCIDMTQPDEGCVDMTKPDEDCIDMTKPDEDCIDMTKPDESCVNMTRPVEGCADMTQPGQVCKDMMLAEEDCGAVGGDIQTFTDEMDKGWQIVGTVKGTVQKKSSGKETKHPQPQIIQSSGNIYHHLDFISGYEHCVHVGSKFEDLVTTFHSVDKCGVDYIFYSVYSKDVVNAKKNRIHIKNVKEGKLKLLGTLSLLSESQIEKLGPLPNEFISSDHLNLMCKFALKVK